MALRAKNKIPVASLEDVIAATAACAATDGNSFGSEYVKAAVRQGIRAAQFGRAIPLPVILDVWAVLDSRRSLMTIFRAPGPKNDSIIAQYNEWLEKFCRNALRCFESQSKARYLGKRDRAAVIRDYLPLVLLAWPKSPDKEMDPTSWAEAYKKILNDAARLRRIHDAWRGSHNTAQELWRQWWKGKPKDEPELYAIGGMWSLFSSGGEPGRLAEKFDYAACQLYLYAADPPLLRDQSQRILRLRQRRREYASVPLVSTYEEQDPHYGQISLVTLSFGRYGVFKIVNNTDPKISNPPSPLPPRRVRVHLCWLNGYKGIAQEHSTRVGEDDERQNAINATEASTLQGLVALLLDDWRNALKDLPVDFFLHCRGSNSETDHMGTAGDRWKQAALGGILPPARMIARAFKRQLHTGLSVDIPWRPHHTQRDWWCACALTRDMTELGFVRRERMSHSTLSRESAWTAPTGVLPNCITHLILVDSPDGTGAVYRAWRTSGNGSNETSAELRPVGHRSTPFTNSDSSFLALRTHVLDVVLDVLEAKMA